ncbi:MAG: hypothetical protein RSB78_00090, partial [Oscillospiraceae bacterium]
MAGLIKRKRRYEFGHSKRNVQNSCRRLNLLQNNITAIGIIVNTESRPLCLFAQHPFNQSTTFSTCIPSKFPSEKRSRVST